MQSFFLQCFAFSKFSLTHSPKRNRVLYFQYRSTEEGWRPTWSRVRDELYEVAQTAHGLPSRPDWTFDTGRGKMIFWVMPSQTKTSLCPLTMRLGFKIQNQRERDLARKVARQKKIKSWWSQNSKNLQLSKCKKFVGEMPARREAQVGFWTQVAMRAILQYNDQPCN